MPLYYLSRTEVIRAWNDPPAPGEKAVANYDEDSLTMVVETARDCTIGIDPESIDGLCHPINE